MVHHTPGTGRAITDYFNSPAFTAPKESELLAAIMTELMRNGRPATNKAMIAAVIAQLKGDIDEARLQSYRKLLMQLLEQKPVESLKP